MESGVREQPLRRSKRRRPGEEAAAGKEKRPTGKEKKPIEKQPTGTVMVDFSLVYQRDPSKQISRGPEGVRDLLETLFTKTQRSIDHNGALIESRILEQTSWSTEDVEFLIMLRSQGDALFNQALKDKKLSRVWEKAAFGLSKDAKVRKDAKQCQWMWYILMKEYNSVLMGKKKQDEFPFYLQMQETRKYRTQTDIARKYE